MAETGKKRSRKAKLVPREYMEIDDDATVSQQELQQSTLSIMPEGSNLPKAMNTFDDGPDYCTTPQVDFSIQVEVESCEEDNGETEGSYRELEPYNPQFSQFIIPKDVLLKEYKEQAKRTTKKVDKRLEIEIMNYLGRFPNVGYVPDKYEDSINRAIEDFRVWAGLAKARTRIFIYKCHVCKIGWWHLDPFRDHIREHAEITIRFANYGHEASIVAEHGSWWEEICDTKVEGLCPQCLKTYEQHALMKKDTVFYFCAACRDKLPTCEALFAHEGVCTRFEKEIYQHSVLNEAQFKCEMCQIECLTLYRYREHVLAMHAPKSDLPILHSAWKMCTACGIKYITLCSHSCVFKAGGAKCHYCFRWYQNTALIKSHDRGSTVEIDCVQCGKTLKRRCMEVEHIVRHSQMYVLGFRCMLCKEYLLALNEYDIRAHVHYWHKLRKKRNVFEAILLPKSILALATQSKPEEVVEMLLDNKSAKNRPAIEAMISVKDVTDAVVVHALNERRTSVMTGDSNDSCSVSVEPSEIDKEDTSNDVEVTQENSTQNCEGIDEDKDETSNAGDTEANEIQDSDVQVQMTLNCETVVDLGDSDENIDVETETREGKRRDDDKTETRETRDDDPQNSFFTLLSSIKQENMGFDEAPVDLEVQIKTELIKEELDDIENENDACLAELSKVFKASKSIKGDTFTSEMLHEEVNIKDEEFDDEEFEDDIIVLDTSKMVNMEEFKNICMEPDQNSTGQDATIINTDNIMNIKTENSDTESEEMDISESLEVTPDILTLAESTQDRIVTRRPKIYVCGKCGYSGEHNAYKQHQRTVCKIKLKKTHSFGVKTFEKCSWTEFLCTKCDVTFVTLKHYLDHFTVHGLEKLCCPHCSRIFPQYPNLSVHVLGHIKLSFMKVQILKQSMCMTSKKSGLYQCRECTKEVTHKDFFSHWEGHLTIKSPQDDSQAADDDDHEDASLTPAQVQKLVAQLTISIEEDASCLKQCVQCSHPFDRRNDCKRHVIEHLLVHAYARQAKYKDIRCQICGIGFEKADGYRRHMRNHGSLPVFNCELCNKSFSDSSNFAKHKKVHNLQKAECDICGKKFHLKSGLEKHMEVHTSPFPLECHYCERKYFCPSMFRKHVRTTHEKPTQHLCKICRKRFNSLRHLWDHMWLVHKRRRFLADCPFCEQSFRKYQDVRDHVKYEHRDVPSDTVKKIMRAIPFKEFTSMPAVEETMTSPDIEEVTFVIDD